MPLNSLITQPLLKWCIKWIFLIIWLLSSPELSRIRLTIAITILLLLTHSFLSFKLFLLCLPYKFFKWHFTFKIPIELIIKITWIRVKYIFFSVFISKCCFLIRWWRSKALLSFSKPTEVLIFTIICFRWPFLLARITRKWIRTLSSYRIILLSFCWIWQNIIRTRNFFEFFFSLTLIHIRMILLSKFIKSLFDFSICSSRSKTKYFIVVFIWIKIRHLVREVSDLSLEDWKCFLFGRIEMEMEYAFFQMSFWSLNDWI